MFLSALARGQGSTIWLISLVATALPPLSAIVSRRSRYSEQPASAVSSAASANARNRLLDGRIVVSFGQIEHMTGERTVAGRSDAVKDRSQRHRLLAGELGFAEQEE